MIAAAALSAAFAWGVLAAGSQTAPGSTATVERIDAEHLPNPVRVHLRVISGGLPEGDAAFAELRNLGVRTVISVDGAKPDVATAKKYGLRYVHLPHGYDGIPEARLRELAKAVRGLPGPVYVHCHHGKHRSPAASAAACVAAGLIPHESARGVLELAGTSENYRGLYASADRARPIDPKTLDRMPANFPETAELPPMAEAMIGIEHSSDLLTAIAAAGWKAPSGHPDVDPTHEALLLREQLTELLRTEEVARRPEGFRRFLRDGEAAAERLGAALRDGGRLADVEAAFAAVTANCSACHKAYRDVPLGENAAE